MWPRLFAQMVELLPHATRLLPLADNYLANRREAERSQASALASMSGSLREEIGHVADVFGSVSRQVAEQKKQIAALQDSLDVAETHRITQTKQLEWITSDLNSIRLWLKFGVAIIIVLLIGLGFLTVQIYRLH